MSYTTQKVARSAQTGRFVPLRIARRYPSMTVVETYHRRPVRRAVTAPSAKRNSR